MFTGSLPPLELPSLSRLDVSSNFLQGELSPEICSNAHSLTSLMLSLNNFSGSINGVFNNCLSLAYLVLSDNKFSGELPGYMGELSLINLEIAKNRLSGKIPDQLWESTTLKEITLFGNFLEGPLSDSVSNVSTLERLLLNDNLLSGSIPSSIGKLKNLTNLSLSGNKFSGDIPSEMFECSKLVSLHLGGNRLTGGIPKSISKLKLLDNLVLSDNHLSGPIPEEICSGFQKVPLPDSEFVQHYGKLDLSHNGLNGPIPRIIKNCLVVEEILLQGNQLNGSIPDEISSLANLTFLDLSFNSFSGSVGPQLLSLMNLQGLVLSHNKFNGFMPDYIWSTLPSLTKLDLSYNSFRGPLPLSLLSLKSLTYLDVSMNSLSGPLALDSTTAFSLVVLNASNNYFSGALDDSFSNLASLSVLDLHNNTFSGTLSPSLSNIASLSYLDLSKNSFQHSFPCNICTIQGLTYSNFSGNRFTGKFPESCIDQHPCLFSPSHDSHTSNAPVFGLAIFVPLVVVIIMLIAFLKWKTKKQDQDVIILGNGKSTTAKRTSSREELLGKKSKEPLSINIATFEHTLLRVKAADISSATENFSQSYIIGDGGFGTVYKARLEGGTIAVKRLNGFHLHGEREFLAEMETIGKVQHENLVPLLGYCAVKDEKFLIYPYMENGSLDCWLRNHGANGSFSLDWRTRFKICVGAAKGIAFLHHGFVPHIIHRDIKSSNILVDRDFEARVSDFGLARIISACESHVSTVLAGSFGYIPPEYGQAMVATAKGDVYSFGVVMMEVVTGRAPTGQEDGEGGNLVGWVRWMAGRGRETEVVESCVGGRTEEMLSVLSIARRCTSDEPWRRPTMLEVVKMLDNIFGASPSLSNGCSSN
ncbi:hypothetical protein ACS0TY_027545 [Phlomoides rotata]